MMNANASRLEGVGLELCKTVGIVAMGVGAMMLIATHGASGLDGMAMGAGTFSLVSLLRK